MAISAAAAEADTDVEIGITLLDKFVACLPDCFRLDENGKLHHDLKKANVFAHDNKLFGNSYGEVVKVTTLPELHLFKQRLLDLPTFFKVELKKERKVYKTRYITKGSFVVYFNARHPKIQEQLCTEFDRCEELLKEGKKFALEVKLGPALNAWYKTKFRDNHGYYTAKGSNFCITNFSQRCHACYNPVLWIGCLPIMLLGAPPYCIYRSIRVCDNELIIDAIVTYIEGVTPSQRRELSQMLLRAYVDGMNAAQTRQQTAPPTYDEAISEPLDYIPENPR